MADADAEPRRIQVANSRPEDSGRGIAHLPRSLMAALGIGEGDVIEIVGKRATPARAVGPYPEDEGLDLLRIDGLQRANAGAGSGTLAASTSCSVSCNSRHDSPQVAQAATCASIRALSAAACS